MQFAFKNLLFLKSPLKKELVSRKKLPFLTKNFGNVVNFNRMIKTKASMLIILFKCTTACLRPLLSPLFSLPKSKLRELKSEKSKDSTTVPVLDENQSIGTSPSSDLNFPKTQVLSDASVA